MDAMAQKYNFTYVIVPAPDNKFGSKSADGKWSGMIGQLVYPNMTSHILYFSKDFINFR